MKNEIGILISDGGDFRTIKIIRHIKAYYITVKELIF